MFNGPVLILLFIGVIFSLVQVHFIQSDVDKYKSVLNAVCHADDKVCHKQAAADGLKCYSPIYIHLSARSACFAAATEKLKKDYFPQMRTPVVNRGMGKVELWAGRAVPAILNYDPQTIDQRIQNSERYFTKSGWSGFMLALGNSGYIDLVKNRNVRIYTVPDTPFTVVNSGGENGVFRWLIKCHATVYFKEFGSQKDVMVPMKVYILLKIENVPDSPDGIGIAQWQTLSDSTPATLAQ